MKKRTQRPATGSKRRARTLAYPIEFRLRIVQLFLEEQYSAEWKNHSVLFVDFHRQVLYRFLCMGGEPAWSILTE